MNALLIFLLIYKLLILLNFYFFILIETSLFTCSSVLDHTLRLHYFISFLVPLYIYFMYYLYKLYIFWIFMPLSPLNSSQLKHCRNSITQAFSAGMSRNKMEDLLSCLDSPKRAVVFYLALQVKAFNSRLPCEPEFQSLLPKSLGEYYCPQDVFDVLKGPFFYKDSELPRGTVKEPVSSLVQVSNESPDSISLPRVANPKPLKKLYSFQIDVDDLDALKIKSDQDGRSVSGTLRVLIRKYLSE